MATIPPPPWPFWAMDSASSWYSLRPCAEMVTRTTKNNLARRLGDAKIARPACGRAARNPQTPEADRQRAPEYKYAAAHQRSPVWSTTR